MLKLHVSVLFTTMVLGAFSANAAPLQIVNLDAGPATGAAQTANAGPTTAANSAGSSFGPQSTAYLYNPIVLTNLAVGSYTVGVAGLAGGGLYDAYTPAVPAAGNFTNAFWSVSTNGVVQTEASIGRFSTAAAAYAAYSALAPFSFTVTSIGQAVTFYVDDAAPLYFLDDAGGISLGINRVPEPITLGLLGIGLVGIGASRRKRRTPVAA